MLKNEKNSTRKSWPANCVWPEPIDPTYGVSWDPEDAEFSLLDEEGEEMFGIKEYYDHLVECCVLNDDYSWNNDKGNAEKFDPDVGDEYWDNGFDYELWEEDVSGHMNMLKLDMDAFDTLCEIEEIIGYQFINENLLRQAFTRRAFAVEYGLCGDNEQLEFLGDSALYSIVTKEIIDQLTETDLYQTDAPFVTRYSEGDFSRIRSSFISKEFLSAKAAELGLDKFILYGSGEQPTVSSREDMMEALIGAVTIDSGWDIDVVEELIDRLLCIQLNEPNRYLKKSYYELLNSWHMKHFGEMPEYTIDGLGPYTCLLRYSIPENDKGLWTRQIQDGRGETRRKAREMAAELAYHFVVANGIWINIKNSGIVPNPEDSINQLQELFQKKYLEEKPEYSFEEAMNGTWWCDCLCSGLMGWGSGASKTQAKKKAAYMLLEKLFSTGLPDRQSPEM